MSFPLIYWHNRTWLIFEHTLHTHTYPLQLPAFYFNYSYSNPSYLPEHEKTLHVKQKIAANLNNNQEVSMAKCLGKSHHLASSHTGSGYHLSSYVSSNPAIYQSTLSQFLRPWQKFGYALSLNEKGEVDIF